MDALKLGPNNRLYLHRQYYYTEVAWPLFENYNLLSFWTWRDSTRADVGEQLLNCAQQARINQDAQKDSFYEDYYKFTELHREIDNYSDEVTWGELTSSRISIFFYQLTMRPGDIVISPNPYDLSDVRVVRLISPIKHSSQLPENISLPNITFKHTKQGLEINDELSSLNYFAEVEPVADIFTFNRYDASTQLQNELRYRGTNKLLDSNLITDVQEVLDANNPLLKTKKALIKKVSSFISSYTTDDLQQLASRYLTRCGANEVTCDAAEDEDFAVTGYFFNLGLNINVAVHAAADGQLTTDLLPLAPDDNSDQNLSWLMTNLPLRKISEDVLKQARTAHVRIIALEELASLILNAGTDLLANSSK